MDGSESLLSRTTLLAFFVFLAFSIQLIVYLDKSKILYKKFRWNLKYWHCCVLFVLFMAVFFSIPDLAKVIIAGIMLFAGIGYRIGKARR